MVLGRLAVVLRRGALWRYAFSRSRRRAGSSSKQRHSLLQLLLDGAYAWGWQSMIGDYILAFSVLGLAGLFHKQKYGFFTGTVAGCVARFLVCGTATAPSSPSATIWPLPCSR